MMHSSGSPLARGKIVYNRSFSNLPMSSLSTSSSSSSTPISASSSTSNLQFYGNPSSNSYSYILWDSASVCLPNFHSLQSEVIQKVCTLSESLGIIRSFKVFMRPMDSSPVAIQFRRTCDEYNIEIEEVTGSIEYAMACEMMNISLLEADQDELVDSSKRTHNMVILSSQPDILRPLATLKASSRISSIVHIHDDSIVKAYPDPALAHKYSSLHLEWNAFLHDTSFPLQSSASTPNSIPISDSGHGLSLKDLPSLASSPSHSATSVGNRSRSTSIASPLGQRSQMGSSLDLQAHIENALDPTLEAKLQTLPPNTRSSLLAFKKVIEYCESEKIIPRESVLRKRLLDTTLVSQQNEIDFEEVLSLSVHLGIAAIEGKAPQRVIYPTNGSSSIRKFECADFFQPTQRLTVEQTLELLQFLNTTSPEAERGRFGFAQYLSANAPPFFQNLPHGVLVELVQLLLNQKILIFRKGRVSVSCNLQFADLPSLAALSVASKPHTPLLSTDKGVQGQQAAVQLKAVYNQLKNEVDMAVVSKASNQLTPKLFNKTDVNANSMLHSQSYPTLSHALSGANSPYNQVNSLSNMRYNHSFSDFDTSLDPEDLAEFKNHDIPSPSSATITKWTPTPLYVKQPHETYVHILSRKYLEAKVDSSSSYAVTSTKFPLAPLWHLELTSNSWSAVLSVEVMGEFLTLSSPTGSPDFSTSFESLSKLALDHHLIWKIIFSSVMRDLRSSRFSPIFGKMGRSFDLQELQYLQSSDFEIEEKIKSKALQNLRLSPILFLDALLSSLQLSVMIYSCEYLRMGFSSGWSVAATVPSQLSPSPSNNRPSVTCFHEDKTLAKNECAMKLLKQIVDANPTYLSDAFLQSLVDLPPAFGVSNGNSMAPKAIGNYAIPKAVIESSRIDTGIHAAYY
jgi:hypothetical protein